MLLVKEVFGNRVNVNVDRMAEDTNDDFNSRIITKDSEDNNRNEERNEYSTDYPNNADSNEEVLLAGNHQEKETTSSEHFHTF